MRIRSIKPEVCSDEDLAALPAETMLLALLLNNYADDEGFFNANPKLVQAALFPLRELSRTIPVMFRDLSSAGITDVRAIGETRQIGRLLRFGDEQVISHPKPSVLREAFEAAMEASRKYPVGCKSESGSVPAGMEGNGTGNREQGAGTRGARGKGMGLLPDEQAEPLRSRLLSLNALFGRKPTTRWSSKEGEAWRNAGLEGLPDFDFAEQVTALSAYYAAPPGLLQEHWQAKPNEDFRRRKIETLLNNWPGELDRAGAWAHWLAKKKEREEAGRL